MAPKAAGSAKKAPAHPKYSALVAEAITELKERNGSSRQAIVKFIEAKYKVGDAGKRAVNAALKKGVASGALTHPKGHAGHYRLAAKAKAEKKPKVAKKKTTTKKATKPKATKPKAAKKTTAKKSPKKATKKTAAKKSPKKATKKAAKTAA